LNTLSNVNGEDLEIKIEWDNDDGTTSTRFYKGYQLHYVFDYTLGSGTNWYSPSATTVYAKWFEHNNWHSASQQVRHANGAWLWSFVQAHELTVNSTGTLQGRIGYRNVGFLLHGSSTGMRIMTGGDQNSSGYYDIKDWTKLRVYARRTELPRQENLIGWYHASTFPATGTSTDSTEWVNSQGLLGPATVTRGTVTKVSPVNEDGLVLDRSLTHYASLDETNIGGTLTFAVWSKNHIDIADFERLFDFSNTAADRIVLYYNKNNPRSIEGQLGSNYTLRIGDVADNHDKSWKHTVWVIDQTSAKQYLYRNGSLVVDTYGDANALEVPTADIPPGLPQQIQRTINHIGASSDLASSKFFDGQIRSLNIWERALSATEIADLYNIERDNSFIRTAKTSITIQDTEYSPDKQITYSNVFRFHNEYPIYEAGVWHTSVANKGADDVVVTVDANGNYEIVTGVIKHRKNCECCPLSLFIVR